MRSASSITEMLFSSSIQSSARSPSLPYGYSAASWSFCWLVLSQSDRQTPESSRAEPADQPGEGRGHDAGQLGVELVAARAAGRAGGGRPPSSTVSLHQAAPELEQPRPGGRTRSSAFAAKAGSSPLSNERQRRRAPSPTTGFRASAPSGLLGSARSESGVLDDPEAGVGLAQARRAARPPAVIAQAAVVDRVRRRPPPGSGRRSARPPRSLFWLFFTGAPRGIEKARAQAGFSWSGFRLLPPDRA